MKSSTLLLSLLLPVFVFTQVAIGTPPPLSTLDINGNLSIKVVNLIGNSTGNQTNTGTTIGIDDGVYISVDPRSG